MTLHPARTDLFLAFPDQIRNERLLTRYWHILSPEERRREERFYCERDRHHYRVSRALVRTVLSQYAPVPPEEWSFSATRYGKPEIVNDCAAAKRISFNLTHTHGLIVLAVACEGTVGVDAEHVRARQPCLEIARRFFARREAEQLFELPAERRSERFFHYWTLKESYIKAVGLVRPVHSTAARQLRPFRRPFDFDYLRSAAAGRCLAVVLLAVRAVGGACRRALCRTGCYGYDTACRLDNDSPRATGGAPHPAAADVASQRRAFVERDRCCVIMYQLLA